ncbi:MAG: hypothetical protein EA392_08550 [Cryomorphaceae bacterium]|nr:MAG: hypothetical protein EA392_08550 [Cryomorphaceae bacterium]
MRLKTSILLLISLYGLGDVAAQGSGQNAFVSSNLIFSARMGALGANGFAIKDGDLNLGTFNPALLDEQNHNQFSFSYINYLSNINYGQVAYARHHEKIGTIAASVNYLSYGQFTETNPFGDETGSFNAGEYIVNLGYSRPIDSLFTFGANAKFFYGQMAEFVSTALAVDLAGVYHNPRINTTVSLMMLNIGAPLSYYTDNDRPNMPFEIQMAITHKLKNAPFRLMMVVENMQQWELVEEDENTEQRDPLTGEIINVSQNTFGENLMRHLAFGVEILIGKNMFLRGGFNYRRRQELKAPDITGLAGISFGFGLRVHKFHLSYGHNTYSLAGASNHLTITTRFSDFAGKN